MSTEVHQAAETVTTSNELDLLFGPLFDEYFNGENQVVLKSSAVTTTDASNKRQQQPDSTSSTSTLASTVTANGNFNLSYALSWKPCQGDSLNLPDHRAQVDQESQIKMIHVKEMMQDNDLKNSKSKHKGSRSRSQSMNEQSHYKQDKTKTRQSINVKSHILNVIGAFGITANMGLNGYRYKHKIPEPNGTTKRHEWICPKPCLDENANRAGTDVSTDTGDDDENIVKVAKNMENKEGFSSNSSYGKENPWNLHNSGEGKKLVDIVNALKLDSKLLEIPTAVNENGIKVHIKIDIHFVRDLVADGQVRVLHVPSRYQYADIFTKGLPSALFEEFRTSLSVHCPLAPTARKC
ncbi:ribonuclease H-like domain-containing protein [Tanacetum coccineum]